jgi:hypothetical protein
VRALLAAIAVISGGCTSTSDTTATTGTINAGLTTVSVDPPAFLGSVSCSDRPGGMQSYVATVVDITDPDRPLTLPSSAPTPCSQSVYFEYIDPGHRYEAYVDGYEAPAQNLVPVCGAPPPTGKQAPANGGKCTSDSECFNRGCPGACKTEAVLDSLGHIVRDDKGNPVTQNVCRYRTVAGNRRMVGRKSGHLITPRFTMPDPCGAHFPVIAETGINVSIAPCGPLSDAAPGKTAIEVDPRSTLTSLTTCQGETATGTVTSFDVAGSDTTANASLAPVKGVACSTKGGVIFDQGIVPGHDYVFTIDAYESGFTQATQAASCFATARQGITVAAACDPLSKGP